MSIDNCPRCNMNFIGEDIYQHFLDVYSNNEKLPTSRERIFKSINDYPDLYEYLGSLDLSAYNDVELNALYTANMYGYTFIKPKFFRNDWHIETGQYDGATWIKCPECKAIWKRFLWADSSYLTEEDRNNIIEIGI